MKKFFQKIGNFFSLLFGGAKKFEKFLIEHVDDAIAVANKIKAILNNPIAIALQSLLPEKFTRPISKFQSILDKVITEMMIADECLQLTTFNDRLQCFLEHISKLSPAMRNAALQKFASLYTKHSSSTDMKERLIDSIVQNRYLESKENLA